MGFFRFGDRVHRPELTISWDCPSAEGPVLVPASLLCHAIQAVHSTRPLAVPRATRKRPHVNLTFGYKRTTFGMTGDEAVNWLGENALWWVGRYVQQLRVISETESDAEAAKVLEQALRLRCEQNLCWDEMARTAELQRHARKIVVDMEKAMVAGDSGTALRQFQKLATWIWLFFQETDFRTVESLAHRQVVLLYAHACYWITTLNSPGNFGWSNGYYRLWAIRRARAITWWTRKMRTAAALTQHLAIAEARAWLRVLDMSTRYHTCGWLIYYALRMVGMLLAPTNIDPIDFGHVLVITRIRIVLDIFGCCDGKGGICGKHYPPGEQDMIVRELAWYEAELNNRYGPPPLIHSTS